MQWVTTLPTKKQPSQNWNPSQPKKYLRPPSILEFFTPSHHPTSVLELFNHHSTGGKKHENVSLMKKLIQYN